MIARSSTSRRVQIFTHNFRQKSSPAEGKKCQIFGKSSPFLSKVMQTGTKKAPDLSGACLHDTHSGFSLYGITRYVCLVTLSYNAILYTLFCTAHEIIIVSAIFTLVWNLEITQWVLLFNDMLSCFRAMPVKIPSRIFIFCKYFFHKQHSIRQICGLDSNQLLPISGRAGFQQFRKATSDSLPHRIMVTLNHNRGSRLALH